MPEEYILASQAQVKLKEEDLPPDLAEKLSSVQVEQHTHLPSMVTIRLNDPGLELLDSGKFNLGEKVQILADTAGGQKVSLFQGEITSLEPEFGTGMIAALVVRGYDLSHRMFRETRSKAYLNVKDSDIAEQIGRAARLRCRVDATRVVYDHVLQHNQSDLAFLMERAWRIGYECYVEGDELFFHKPKTEHTGAVTLTWGSDLLSFHPRMSLAEQVNEVSVRGWDVQKKEAFIGKAQQGGLYPDISEQKDGAAWSRDAFKKESKLTIVNQPSVSQAEADLLASARMDEISGAFVEAEGVAIRRPDIRAGKLVKLEALGRRFSGTYLVTSATHTYSPEGLLTTFHVRGTRTGLLSEALAHEPPAGHWSGVVPGVVTNTDDPKKWGRVKVKFPWLDKDVESDWARVIGPGGGNESGLCAIPAEGDEVAVALGLHGFEQLFVLGGLWNGQDALPPATAGAGNGEKPKVRSWRSRTGHHITMFDTSDAKIEIQSADGRSIVVDDKNSTITIKTSNANITLKDDQLSVDASTSITVKAGTSLKLESSGSMELKASGQLTLKGATILLN